MPGQTRGRSETILVRPGGKDEEGVKLGRWHSRRRVESGDVSNDRTAGALPRLVRKREGCSGRCSSSLRLAALLLGGAQRATASPDHVFTVSTTADSGRCLSRRRHLRRLGRAVLFSGGGGRGRGAWRDERDRPLPRDLRPDARPAGGRVGTSRLGVQAPTNNDRAARGDPPGV